MPTGDEDSATPRTDWFLVEHTLMHMGPMINLIARSVPVVKWSDELRCFAVLMPELVDRLLKEMDNDRLAVPL
jgi:hypothetical protein